MFRQDIRLVAIAVLTKKMAVDFLVCHDHSSQCIEYELFDDPANNYMIISYKIFSCMKLHFL